MIRLGRILASCALAALLAGCGDLPPIFEDVGADPHPPELALLGIGLQLPGDPPPPPAYGSPAAGLTLRPEDPNANVMALRVAYADAGADIASVSLRDLDGSLGGDAADTSSLGTAGTLEFTVDATATVDGPHRLELWAEDGHGSRSAKTSFTVTIQLF
jgi:hypothetical protein